MAAAGIILAVLSLLGQFGGGMYQMLVAKFGSDSRGKAMTLIAQIAKKIAGNNALLQQLQSLYNERNQAGLNELYKGMGFGPRATALLDSIKENEGWYRSKIREINEQNKGLESLQNMANAAVSNAGTSLEGNRYAQDMNQVVEGTLSKIPDLEQNIKGGTK